MTQKNNSDSLLPAMMKSIMSMKVELCLSALWFHIGVWFQRVPVQGSNIGHGQHPHGVVCRYHTSCW